MSLCLFTALAHLPNLFVLHLERNAISKLEPTGLLSSLTPKLRELYLTNNTITSIAKGALESAHLGTLHLDSNQLTEMPTHALSEAPNLEELSLSQNSIHLVGPNAFKPISQSLKRLYMDHMGMEKVHWPFILANMTVFLCLTFLFFWSHVLTAIGRSVLWFKTKQLSSVFIFSPPLSMKKATYLIYLNIILFDCRKCGSCDWFLSTSC